jgi:hypothetical protein
MFVFLEEDVCVWPVSLHNVSRIAAKSSHKWTHCSISLLEVTCLLFKIFFRRERRWRVADVHDCSDILSTWNLVVMDLATVPQN